MSEIGVIRTMNLIVKLIPDEFPDFRNAVETFVDGAFLELPEANHRLWREGAQVLAECLPEHAEMEDYDPWQRSILELWQRSVKAANQS